MNNTQVKPVARNNTQYHTTPNPQYENRGQHVEQAVTIQKQNSLIQNTHFTPKQVEVLRNTFCKGLSLEEIEVFLMHCVRTKLDPFTRQIYAIKRGDTMTIQTAIGGYRLIAERTERYAPGQEPTYRYDEKGALQSATAYVKKQTHDGTWHVVSASAYMDEYCQRGRDGRPMGLWSKMPRTMLAKCAESQALRLAFPGETAGIYTQEEMDQADVPNQGTNRTDGTIPKISMEQAMEIEEILAQCDEKYSENFRKALHVQYHTDNLCDVPVSMYDRMKSAALTKMQEFQDRKKQVEQLENSIVEEVNDS